LLKIKGFEPKGPFGGSAATQIGENNEYILLMLTIMLHKIHPTSSLIQVVPHYNNQNL